MKQSLGPPVLIPAGGFRLPPVMGHALLWSSMLIIGTTLAAIPILIIIWAICAIITFIWDQIDPPLIQPTSDCLPETNPIDPHKTT